MITAMPRIAIAMHDFDQAITTFRDILGMPVLDFSSRTVPGLGAHVAMCVPPGGSNVELMAPANPAEPLSQALQRFLDKRGDGLYALMLEAPVPNEEAEELAARGLDVLPLMTGAGGRDVHPRSTHGVLVRVYPVNSAGIEGEHPNAAPGLSGIARVIVATHDAESSAAAYGHGFGLDVDPATTDHDRGVRSVVCRPPAGGVIELVSIVDPAAPFAQHLHQFVTGRGEGMHTLVLEAADPTAAVAVLAERGADFTTEGSATGHPEAVLFGARFAIAPAHPTTAAAAGYSSASATARSAMRSSS